MNIYVVLFALSVASVVLLFRRPGAAGVITDFDRWVVKHGYVVLFGLCAVGFVLGVILPPWLQYIILALAFGALAVWMHRRNRRSAR